MIANISNVQRSWSALTGPILVISILVATIPALAQNSKSFRHDNFFQPGNLVVSRTVYDNLASNVTVGEPLPPNCVATSTMTASPPSFDWPQSIDPTVALYEPFFTIREAGFGEVLRGVSFPPGTELASAR